jgi:lysozyme
VRTREVSAAMIRHFEGFRSTAYNKDGKWTVGFGHTLGVKQGDKIDLDLAIKLFEDDLTLAEMCVQHLVKVPLTPGQWDALVSFTFNLGAGRLAKSTLLHKLNERDYNGAAREFGKWIFGADPKDPEHKRKIILDGLVKRRAWETTMFMERTT